MASLAKPGQAGLAKVLARLTRKAWPGKAWQAWSTPSICGKLGHRSMAFPAKQKNRLAFLGLPGQKPGKPRIPGHVLQVTDMN